jgi:type II secretory pathway pseudopilin PulG
MSRAPSRRARQAGVTIVELMVVMVVMTIVSTMIIGIWFALNNAYSFESVSAHQQDLARMAISRMGREIRDAQAPPVLTATAIEAAQPYDIEFYSTFNTTGAPNPAEPAPRLTRFIFRETDTETHVGALYRELAGADGVFDTADDQSMMLLDHVVNRVPTPNRDLFTYYAFDGSGNLFRSSDTSVTVSPTAVVDVQITLLVDLNPGKSPRYVTVQTTVQPRNMRHL